MDASARYDVFISYSTSDRPWADAVVETLERGGVRCWIAPRDIVAGKSWPAAIVEAIHGCQVMVLIFSHSSNASEQVTRELVQAADRKVHVLPLRIDDVAPSSDKAYYLSGAHWLSVAGGPTEDNLAHLEGDVRRLLQLPVASRPARARGKHVARWPYALAGLVVIATGLVTWKFAGGAPASAQEEPGPPEPNNSGNDANAARKDELERGQGPAPKPEPAPKPVELRNDELRQTSPNGGSPVDPRWSEAPAAIRDRFEPEDTRWLDAGGRELPARIRHRETGVSFVLVPAGKFELGASALAPDTEDDEHPPRTVRMSAFYIARLETTRGQFEGTADTSGEPIVNVTWQQANDWCRKHGFALPSEAQWEYAASGPENRRFPWGDTWNLELCNSMTPEDGARLIARAGSYSPGGASWCGAEDMAGNAAEWCRGFHTASYADLTGDLDPESPARGDFRVARGGSWSDGQSQLRTSDRRRYQTEKRGDGLIGFRAVFEP